ncbi:hypothetical protein VPH35_008020 [Triticum aestivum]
MPSKAPWSNPIAPHATTPPSLFDISPSSAATNPSPISYNPAVATPPPSDLRRQPPPPLRLLCPPTACVQVASFLPPRPSPLSPQFTPIPCCPRCSSSQVVRKPREDVSTVIGEPPWRAAGGSLGSMQGASPGAQRRGCGGVRPEGVWDRWRSTARTGAGYRQSRGEEVDAGDAMYGRGAGSAFPHATAVLRQRCRHGLLSTDLFPRIFAFNAKEQGRSVG